MSCENGREVLGDAVPLRGERPLIALHVACMHDRSDRPAGVRKSNLLHIQASSKEEKIV
jgi:hypothetical protein